MITYIHSAILGFIIICIIYLFWLTKRNIQLIGKEICDHDLIIEQIIKNQAKFVENNYASRDESR
jgi:hypothetical protein